MVHIEKKKSKFGGYDYVPGFTIEGALIKKLGLKKMPRLGEKLKIEGTVEATNLGKGSMVGADENSARISFEFKEMEIASKGDEVADKMYDKEK